MIIALVITAAACLLAAFSLAQFARLSVEIWRTDPSFRPVVAAGVLAIAAVLVAIVLSFPADSSARNIPAKYTGAPRCATSGATSWCRAHASYYTPESSGGPFACQDQFPGSAVVRYDDAHRGVIGVAHKTLPCGTRVRLLYKHRRLTVRVIDRGPYITGREFDLTSATRDRLRFPSTGQLSWRIVTTP